MQVAYERHLNCKRDYIIQINVLLEIINSLSTILLLLLIQKRGVVLVGFNVQTASSS